MLFTAETPRRRDESREDIFWRMETVSPGVGEAGAFPENGCYGWLAGIAIFLIR